MPQPSQSPIHYQQPECSQENGTQLMQLGLEGVEAYLLRIRTALERRDYAAKKVAIDRVEHLVQHLLLRLEEQTSRERMIQLDRLYRYLLLKLAYCNMFNDLDALKRCDLVVQDLRLEWSCLHEKAQHGQIPRMIDFNDMLGA
ncbi:hypothetical protein B1757_05685 [Acidithiobacillus marinus]|uniref:Flagellar export chaperone FliS n=1 Tax=Acidithiobacillus marinus TaxID=187490 RepID=A0A2I1DN27_9PROT|nr:flagellar protein FliS [Acidithiobacillus marinus]PKY11276.1 hypothetical protein B1757_05685 [Acidithiobacillus marinus]